MDKVTIQAEYELQIDDLPEDAGWAWAITIEKGAAQLIMIRKNVEGSELAFALAKHIIRLLKKEDEKAPPKSSNQ